MPELPECECVVRSIRPYVWGCKIIGFMHSNDLKHPPGVLHEQVKGRRIHNVTRRGKYIVFSLDQGYMVSHLRMTGQWFFTPLTEAAPNSKKHFRWGFSVTDTAGEFAGYLWFRDPRKFGTIDWVCSLANYEPFTRLGPDGLDLIEPKVAQQIMSVARSSRKPIKNFILDQGVIAGVGNIYASESLFEAGIDPLKPAKEVEPAHIIRLCVRLHAIFKRSILLGGSSISDYEGGSYNEELRVYGRDGQPCVNCETKIEKVVMAGRSTFFCPSCQGVEDNELF